MAITTQGDMIDVQILMDVVRGKFKGKNAFMGSIFQIEPVVAKSAPEVGRRLRDARVDIALLVPV